MNVQITLLFHLHHETEAERPTPQAYRELLSLARQADRLPIERIWLAEHHLLPERGRLPAPLLMSVAMARETTRIGVGPCVIVLPLHHPLDVAEQVAVSDLLTDGRLGVGIGSGGNAEEFAAFGVPLEERRSRFDEGVEILTRALGDAPFSYTGRHYTIPEVRLVPQPRQQVRDLLWVAAGSPASAALAGRRGAHLLLARGTALGALQEQIAAYRAARAEAGFGTISASIQVTRGLYVAETEERAWSDAEEGIRRHYRRLARYQDEDIGLRKMADRGDFIVGTPTQCAAAIRDLCSQVPITHLACDIALIGMPVDRVARSLELLGQQVIPLLRAT